MYATSQAREAENVALFFDRRSEPGTPRNAIVGHSLHLCGAQCAQDGAHTTQIRNSRSIGRNRK